MITLAAWPLAAWLRDYRAIVSLLLIKSVFSLITSHLVSERRYQLSWQSGRLRDAFRFGWPLILSGFVMFGVFQGDRMLIAGAYTLSDLGVYAVASTLAMTPCFIIFRISGTASLPVMARVQDDPEVFRAYYKMYAQALAFVATIFAIMMVLSGEMMITLLFGSKYREAAALAGWLAIGQTLRIIRGAPTCAAMAKGDTVNTLSSNLWRLSGLIFALPFVFLKMDLYWIAIAGGLGELLALSASIIRLRRKHGLIPSDCIYPAALVCALVTVALITKVWIPSSSFIAAFLSALVECGITVVVFAMAFPALRRVSFSLAREVMGKVRAFTNKQERSATEAVSTNV